MEPWRSRLKPLADKVASVLRKRLKDLQDGWFCRAVMADIIRNDGLSDDTNHCMGSTTAISSPRVPICAVTKRSDFEQVLKTSHKDDAGAL